VPSKFQTIFLATLALILFFVNFARADALAKLKPDKLEAVHQAIQTLRGEWRLTPREGPFLEYRANFHVHSLLSHDSRGTIEEIVSAAKLAGTSILMFTEHPSDKYDYVKDGHRGIKDGVLLIPGAETNGFLIFPTRSLRGQENGSPQEFADLVRGRGGMIFLSHLEERMDWEIRGLTGTEIYNTHADFKDETNLQKAMRNPLWIIQAAELFRKYPQESFSALQDYPADYLKKWDFLCQKAPHTGVAANDAHQNVGLVIRLAEGGKVRGEDALGKNRFELDLKVLPIFQPLIKDKKVGDIIFQARLDPYEISLRHVGTHLLMTEQTDHAVWDALEAGRAFVAFDWLGDSSGFDFAAYAQKNRYEMGSRVALSEGLKIRAQAPLPGKWRLLRNGQIVVEQSGRRIEVAVSEPGNYRVEVWLKVAGEDMIWILSNPIYVSKK
jgi:hypothetical protein